MAKSSSAPLLARRPIAPSAMLRNKADLLLLLRSAEILRNEARHSLQKNKNLS
jgi:hypothetical protein